MIGGETFVFEKHKVTSSLSNFNYKKIIIRNKKQIIDNEKDFPIKCDGWRMDEDETAFKQIQNLKENEKLQTKPINTDVYCLF